MLEWPVNEDESLDEEMQSVLKPSRTFPAAPHNPEYF